MRKILSLMIVCIFAVTANAVPARRGWQTVTQPDGTKLEVQTIGDEFYHYMINRDGKEIVRNEDGVYEVVGDAPTAVKARARRAQGKARRARKAVGVTPNPAPKGVVILVNFSKLKFKEEHTKATFVEMCNAENCTTNGGYPSAAEYFNSQSNGIYRPVFDVFGPVTLSNDYDYYGGKQYGYNDYYATDAVIEACIKANQQYPELNFKDYSSDGKKVDFVYVIYAGYGENETYYFAPNYIWPHNYEIQTVVAGGGSEYSKDDTKLDGVYLDNYAMSNELGYKSQELTGIGTLCHEFGHVIGLPDFYDTNANEEDTYNTMNCLTPNDWDVMDGGAYNGDSHCPPNYSPWEKYFFGWHTPINLGNEGQILELKANGTEGYQAYQINKSGKQQTATTAGECYYIENRQAQGWDEPLTGHGMLIWKVDFDEQAWRDNVPNNTDGLPRMTIVSAVGTKIGWDNYNEEDNCPKNTYPGSGEVVKDTIAEKPLLNITEKKGIVSLIYIEEPKEEITPFDVAWYANGALVTTNQCTKYGEAVLPTSDPEACADGKEFMGWCSQADYQSESTAPTFVKAGDKVEEGAKFYAVFATKAEGAAEETNTYTFTSEAWEDATKSWTSTKDGYGISGGRGVQVTTGVTGAGAKTKEEQSGVSKVVVTYCTNATKGAGSIKVSVGNTSLSQNATKQGGGSPRTLEYSFNKVSGKVAFEVSCTDNSVYVSSVAVTLTAGPAYTNYTTSCGGDETDIENTNVAPAAVKVIRNGQLVILRGNAVYSVTGARLQ